MEKKFKREETPNERFRRMAVLIAPFIKKYGGPVLVHSTPDSVIFKKIISDGKLMVPSKGLSVRKPHIEMMFGLYPSIFFSLGFQYIAGYNFKYGLIFSMDLLKDARYYNRSISFRAYKETATFWDEHNPEYLVKLSKKSKLAKGVVDKFYKGTFNGKKKSMFDFWKCENEVYDLIKKYPRKDELIKMYRKIAREKFIKYPLSIGESKKDFNQIYAPEIISLKDVDLINNSSFLGFYVGGKIPNIIESSLKKRFAGKILFDGKKIRVIK